jgi:putative aldouronate transport system permease protein
MVMHESRSEKLFTVFNYVFLVVFSLLCILPMINVLAVSFSEGPAAEGGLVGLWPIGANLKSYEYIVSDGKFARALVVSPKRLALGLAVTMSLTALAAYPLSKSKEKFRARERYVWFFLITMIFNGGLIPTYIVVQKAGLTNTIWALVLPQALPVFNVILLQNFFKALPTEIEESAFMDGAGHWQTLVSLYLPLSKPVLATLTLFVAVHHWNSWFDGLIYINSPTRYPLQSYLQTVVVNPDFATLSSQELQDMWLGVVAKNSKAATIFLAAAPIIVLYPFLQRYFLKGLVLGSVKG